MTIDKKLVCVTGGNGYIASMLIKQLLQKGYAVNTTVRNPGMPYLFIHSFSSFLIPVHFLFI
jgi:nucleoside-diphosphate-sugar epimerase